MATTNSADFVSKLQNETVRPLPVFPECIWTDRIKSTVVDDQAYERQGREIETLKEEVGSMLIKVKEGTTLEKLKLIDTVEQLGISYHFENEIEFLLDQLFLQNGHSDSQEGHLQLDLYATALLFRLLRQHGYSISSGIFSRFLNSNGKFEEDLSSDKKGLLSLYQAAHTGTPKENILEEALSFASTHLKSEYEEGIRYSSSSLAKQISHALQHPLHKSVPRIEARRYISIYEEDEQKHPLLLRFAKLDYSHLQVLHKKELDQLFRWCEDLEVIVLKVEYSRDRLVECYFWALALFFEPQYSLGRLLCAKTLAFVSILDDTYDSYGTLDELELFRDALERWDIREIDELPKYMKGIYIGLMNLCEWCDEELTKQGKSRPYAVSKFKEEWKRYVRTSYTQSIWFLKRQLPTFQDYKEIAVITSSYFVLAPASFLFLDATTEDVFDWLSEDPKILMANSELGRFINDVASYEREKQKGGTGIECYMEHYNVSEEEAMKKFEEIGEDAWEVINQQLLRPTAMPREILMPILNCARISDFIYKNRCDGFTYPAQNMEIHIGAVLFDLIAL